MLIVLVALFINAGLVRPAAGQTGAVRGGTGLYLFMWLPLILAGNGIHERPTNTLWLWIGLILGNFYLSWAPNGRKP